MANFRLTDGPNLWPSAGDSITENPIVQALPGEDTLEGTSFNDNLSGNEDNDTITGATGSDTLYGGQGDDDVSGGDQADLLFGNLGNDLIAGGVGFDTIYGGQNDDTINGDNGDDLLLGNLGKDNIDGGNGNDTVYGGQDDDTINGGDKDDLLLGNLGNDSIDGGSGNDLIYGGQENDTISGGEGFDTIFAGIGDDVILISTDDVVEGEVYDGGEGEDVVSVTLTTNLSTVTLVSVEELNVLEGATAIVSAENLEGITKFTSTINTEFGFGTVQILLTSAEINAQGILNSIVVGNNVEIIDIDGQGVGNLTLTSNPDTLVGEGEFLAPVAFEAGIGQLPTLQSDDNLTGTGDTDSLSATMDFNTTIGGIPETLVVSPTITDIESLSFRAIKRTTIDAVRITGANDLTSAGSTGDLTIDRIQQLPESVTLDRTAGNFILSVTNSELTGNNDALLVNLNSVNAENRILEFAPASGFNGIEILNLEVSDGPGVLGAITDNTSTSMREINLNGDQNIQITGIVSPEGVATSPIPEEVSLVDASGGTDPDATPFSGNIVIGNIAPLQPVLSGGIPINTGFTFIGGDGNDSLFMGATLDASDDIDGGGTTPLEDGTDGRNSLDAIFTRDGTGVNLDTDGQVGPLKIENIQNFSFMVGTTPGGIADIVLNDVNSIAELTVKLDTDLLGNQNDNPDFVSINNIASIPDQIFLQGSRRDQDQQLDFVRFTSSVTGGNNDTFNLEINNQDVEMRGSEADFDFSGVDIVGIEDLNIVIKDGNLTVGNDRVLYGTGDANRPDPLTTSEIVGSDLTSITIEGDVSIRRINATDENIGTVGSLLITNNPYANGGAQSGYVPAIALPTVPNGQLRNIDEIDLSGVTGTFVGESNTLASNALVKLAQGQNIFDASASAPHNDFNTPSSGIGVRILGQDADDIITDSEDDDRIQGGGNQDTINITTGGNDRIILTETNTADLITGFSLGDPEGAPVQDIFQLVSESYGTPPSGNQQFVLAGNEAPINANPDIQLYADDPFNNNGTILVMSNQDQYENLFPTAGLNTDQIRFALTVDGADTSLLYSGTGNFSSGQYTRVAVLSNFTNGQIGGQDFFDIVHPNNFEPLSLANALG